MKSKQFIIVLIFSLFYTTIYHSYGIALADEKLSERQLKELNHENCVEFSKSLRELLLNNTGKNFKLELKVDSAIFFVDAALKQIKSIGQEAWDNGVSTHIKKVFLSEIIRNSLEICLSYRVLVTILEASLESNVEGATARVLKEIGIDGFLATFITKLIINVLSGFQNAKEQTQ